MSQHKKITPSNPKSSRKKVPDPWFFYIKSYFINITNMPVGSKALYAAAIAVTDNHKGATGDSQKHAVLEFYWDAARIPDPGVPNETGLLHLYYSVAEYAGILYLLKSKASLRCYYDFNESYGGISHEHPVSR